MGSDRARDQLPAERMSRFWAFAAGAARSDESGSQPSRRGGRR